MLSQAFDQLTVVNNELLATQLLSQWPHFELQLEQLFCVE